MGRIFNRKKKTNGNAPISAIELVQHKRVNTFQHPGYKVGGRPTAPNYAKHGSTPSFRHRGLTSMYDGNITIPRIDNLRYWMTAATSANMEFVFEKEPVCNLVTNKIYSMCRGSGVNVTIYGPDKPSGESGLSREIDNEKTKLNRQWFDIMGGIHGSFENYVLKWMIMNNFIHGWAPFYKFRPERVSPLDSKDEVYLMELDPRLLTVSVADYQPNWEKYELYPSVQSYNLHNRAFRSGDNRDRFSLQPSTFKEFMDTPTSVRGYYGIYGTRGQQLKDPPMVLLYSKVVNCRMFGYSPMSVIMEPIVMKIELMHYLRQFVKKHAYPVPIIKVARDPLLDADPVAFVDKVNNAAEIGSQLATGECLAIPGNYIHNGVEMKGWEIETLDMQSGSLDWDMAFDNVNREIMWGLMVNPSAFGGAERGKMVSGGYQGNESLITLINMIRRSIEGTMVPVIIDYLEYKTGDRLTHDQVVFEWSRIRDTDIAVMLQSIPLLLQHGLIDIREGRTLLNTVELGLTDRDNKEMLDFFDEYKEIETKTGRPLGGGEANPQDTGSRAKGYGNKPSKRASNTKQVKAAGGGKTGRVGN